MGRFSIALLVLGLMMDPVQRCLGWCDGFMVVLLKCNSGTLVGGAEHGVIEGPQRKIKVLSHEAGY